MAAAHEAITSTALSGPLEGGGAIIRTSAFFSLNCLLPLTMFCVPSFSLVLLLSNALPHSNRQLQPPRSIFQVIMQPALSDQVSLRRYRLARIQSTIIPTPFWPTTFPALLSVSLGCTAPHEELGSQ